MHLATLILAVCFAALTLPFVLELALVTLGNLFFGDKETPAAPLAGTLTIIIPAHNEQLLIERTVRSLQTSADADTRILVVAHNCNDSTAAVARSAGADVLELRESSGKGKGIALQGGFAHAIAAGAGAVAVVDADSTASAGFIPAIRTALGRADAVQCRYELENGPQYSRAANLQALAFRAINTIRARGRSALGLSSGIFGNGFALRTSLLAAVPYRAFSIAEDLEYHIALVRRGYRVAYTEAALMTGAGADGKAAVAQRSRWEGGRLRVARENCATLLGQVLTGKFRLLEPLLELLTLPLALGVALLLLAFGGALALPMLLLKLYAVAALAIVALHVAMAVQASPAPAAALNLLLRVPFYIVWKVALLPRILARSRRNAQWERSARSATPAGLPAEDNTST